MKRVFLAMLTFMTFASFYWKGKDGTLLRVPRPPAYRVAFQEEPHILHSGETLWNLCKTYLTPQEMQVLIQEMEPYFSEEQLKPGCQITFFLTPTHDFLSGLALTTTEGVHIQAWRYPFEWEISLSPKETRWEPRRYTRTIQTHLIQGVKDAGATPALALEIMKIFQWDIDFYRDLHKGDRFSVLCLASPEGEILTVLAAEIWVGKKHLQAYRFRGYYYDEKGKALKKMFLRAPLSSATISSYFSYSRYHPILKKRMPHFGVDYRAPVGTPVVATAKGYVDFAGWKKGYGKTVVIKHRRGIKTWYLHLSRFGKGIKPGKPVNQGQVIGYVGSTGLATGPHVDYRITHYGKYVNPLRFVSPPAPPLPDEPFKEFQRLSQNLKEKLKDAKG